MNKVLPVSRGILYHFYLQLSLSFILNCSVSLFPLAPAWTPGILWILYTCCAYPVSMEAWQPDVHAARVLTPFLSLFMYGFLWAMHPTCHALPFPIPASRTLLQSPLWHNTDLTQLCSMICLLFCLLFFPIFPSHHKNRDLCIFLYWYIP